MKPIKLLANTIRIGCALALAGMVLTIAGPARTVRAATAPTITVSCAVTPQALTPGSTALLSVSVENVPAAASRTEGMNLYDISLNWTADGLITFTETVPQFGPAPWDQASWEPEDFNFIDNTTGTMRSARMKANPNESFSGTGILFTAPFILNHEGAAEFKFTAADIPFHWDEDYIVQFKNCSVTSLEQGPPPILLFLPYMKR